MDVGNFTICLGLRDFGAADRFRMGMIERFIIDDAGIFDLRIREIHAIADIEDNFDNYLDLAREDALAGEPADCHVHIFDFRVCHADALGKFHGAYSMCTMHLGDRLIGRRFESAVTIPERFTLSDDRLFILINRRWPPLVGSRMEQKIASEVIDQSLRGFKCGYDLYLTPALNQPERQKLQ